MTVRGVGGMWTLAARVVLAAVAVAGCSWQPGDRMPPAPPDVRAAVTEVEAAFAALPDEPRVFHKAAVEAVPKLRTALQAWSTQASGVGARNLIRGWALEAGMLESSMAQLPDRVEANDCGSITAAWKRLRSKLP